ncbi:uncharacterized protein LOC106766010 [Vigna radiata var. radiata]|uniref:Uncharacterized protein LOC106766010 n=1 Tax=Vigna radiata var. radiata TaxID=3916 RepID=A0A1S3UJY6_VIGRR|nr:uncharacterized protein LOC106766010 [Vigna radiata var. radiata]
MCECKEAATPMATNCYLDKGEKGKDDDQRIYKGMIESLHMATNSYIDKGEKGKDVDQRMYRVKGTKGENLFLEGYSDLDFGGCKLDRKSTSGICHLLGGSPISWNSKKQACVALSTTEAKYIAAGSCCAQSL